LHWATNREGFTDIGKLNLVKLVYGGKVLGLSIFSLLPLLTLKTMLASKVVKNDAEIT